ncbi:MAG: hypothetical protein WC906_00395 [Parcubacteria group bacterium]|jgi:hypothetical protein
MDKVSKKFRGNLGIFLYKILSDILSLLLVFFALLLVSEGVMPGLASSHLSFTRLSLIIFAVLGSVIYLGKINEISFEMSNKKTALSCGLIVFAVILIINSMLKFDWWEIAVITIAAILLLFYLYKNFISEKDVIPAKAGIYTSDNPKLNV